MVRCNDTVECNALFNVALYGLQFAFPSIFRKKAFINLSTTFVQHSLEVDTLLL